MVETKEMVGRRVAQRRKTLARFMLISMLLIMITCSFCGCFYGYLSMENYNKISTGMTYEQVVDILDGHKGKVSTSVDMGYGMGAVSAYAWSDLFETKVITVSFYQNRVTMKAQVGLD